MTSSRKPRIALGSILTECNQRGGSPSDISWFERYDLHWGEELLQVKAGVVGGGLEILRQDEADIAPLLNASTCPGGYLTAACYAQLKGELLRRLKKRCRWTAFSFPCTEAPSLKGSTTRRGT